MKEYKTVDQVLEAYTKYWKLDIVDMNWLYKITSLGLRDVDCRIFSERYLNKPISKYSWLRFKKILRTLRVRI